MALPPTIPTSFVPHPASSNARRMSTDILGAFGFFAYFVFAVAVISAIGVFGYDRLLAAQVSSTGDTLKKAEVGLDPATVANFIRLRDRLSSGETLLKNHVAFSQLFSEIEQVVPKTTRLTHMHLTSSAQAKATFTASGSAKTFNALAAASNTLGQNAHIRDAIFSNISIGSNNVVGFDLTATIDPALVAFKVPGAATTTP